MEGGNIYVIRMSLLVSVVAVLWMITTVECWSNCSTPYYLRDKWYFTNEARTSLRIRKKSFVFKNPGYEILRYKCIRSNGNTFLLRIQDTSPGRDGVVCIGFAPLGRRPVTEYIVYRLNSPPTSGHRLVAPEEIDKTEEPPIMTDVCKGAGNSTKFYIQRAIPGCKFPPGLRREWQTSLQMAWRVDIRKSGLSIRTMDGKSHSFRCERRDKDLFLLRTSNLLEGKDGILCLHIVPLKGDKFYNYQMSRTNSGFGSRLIDLLLLVPRDRPVRLYEDCDWLYSPARPEFLYT